MKLFVNNFGNYHLLNRIVRILIVLVLLKRRCTSNIIEQESKHFDILAEIPTFVY